MLYQDERVMNFDRSLLNENWADFYKYISKDATTERKMWMQEQFPKSIKDLPSEPRIASMNPDTLNGQ
jgi:hypothetical protein